MQYSQRVTFAFEGIIRSRHGVLRSVSYTPHCFVFPPPDGNDVDPTNEIRSCSYESSSRPSHRVYCILTIQILESQNSTELNLRRLSKLQSRRLCNRKVNQLFITISIVGISTQIRYVLGFNHSQVCYQQGELKTNIGMILYRIREFLIIQVTQWPG